MVNLNIHIKQTGVLKKTKASGLIWNLEIWYQVFSFFGLAFGKDVYLLKFVLHVTTCNVRRFSLRVASINLCSQSMILLLTLSVINKNVVGKEGWMSGKFISVSKNVLWLLKFVGWYWAPLGHVKNFLFLRKD